MLEVGKKYYFIAHAYYHYVGEVVEVLPRFVIVKHCCQVHSCPRGWSEFLRIGFGTDTNYDVMLDGSMIPYGALPIYPWPHEIPRDKKRRS